MAAMFRQTPNEAARLVAYNMIIPQNPTPSSTDIRARISIFFSEMDADEDEKIFDTPK